MESTPRLYETLVQVLSHHPNWVALRPLKTLAGLMVGLLPAGNVRLTAWAPYVHRRAVFAPSPVRRFARGLAQERLDVQALAGPLLPQALAAWGTPRLSLARDPSTLGHTYGLVRRSLVSRGRAVPSGGNVREQPGRRGASTVDKAVREKVAERLPFRCPVGFAAARGVADPHLRAHLARWGGHWRRRLTGRVWIYRRGKRRCHVHRLPVSPGMARLWHQVDMTTQGDGPVHLALGRPKDRQAYWFVVRDAPTEAKTCAA